MCELAPALLLTSSCLVITATEHFWLFPFTPPPRGSSDVRPILCRDERKILEISKQSMPFIVMRRFFLQVFPSGFDAAALCYAQRAPQISRSQNQRTLLIHRGQ